MNIEDVFYIIFSVTVWIKRVSSKGGAAVNCTFPSYIDFEVNSKHCKDGTTYLYNCISGYEWDETCKNQSPGYNEVCCKTDGKWKPTLCACFISSTTPTTTALTTINTPTTTTTPTTDTTAAITTSETAIVESTASTTNWATTASISTMSSMATVAAVDVVTADTTEPISTTNTSVTSCLELPCQNGGTCKHILTGNYRCNCLITYAGVQCETSVCLPFPTWRDVVVNDSLLVPGMTYIYHCRDGYQWDQSPTYGNVTTGYNEISCTDSGNWITSIQSCSKIKNVDADKTFWQPTEAPKAKFLGLTAIIFLSVESVFIICLDISALCGRRKLAKRRKEKLRKKSQNKRNHTQTTKLNKVYSERHKLPKVENRVVGEQPNLTDRTARYMRRKKRTPTCTETSFTSERL